MSTTNATQNCFCVAEKKNRMPTVVRKFYTIQFAHKHSLITGCEEQTRDRQKNNKSIQQKRGELYMYLCAGY